MKLPGFSAESSLNKPNAYRQPTTGVETRGSAIVPQLRVGGGGGLSNTCDDKYGECYIDCSVRYPESKDPHNNLNELLRQGCFDSCDAAHDLCGGGGLAFGRMKAARIPISSGLARASFT